MAHVNQQTLGIGNNDCHVGFWSIVIAIKMKILCLFYYYYLKFLYRSIIFTDCLNGWQCLQNMLYSFNKVAYFGLSSASLRTWPARQGAEVVWLQTGQDKRSVSSEGKTYKNWSSRCLPRGRLLSMWSERLGLQVKWRINYAQELLYEVVFAFMSANKLV